jgi:hypothetical protein
MRTEMNMQNTLKQSKKIMRKVHSTVKEGPAHAEKKVHINYYKLCQCVKKL